MDVYQKVLHKLYEVTDGKSSKAVDFRGLVKQLGFPGFYADIFEQLSGQGWIVETPKADYVNISHWGVAEVKKLLTPAEPAAVINPALKAEISKALATTKELSALLENFSRKTGADNFAPVEKKLSELQTSIAQIRTNMD